MQQHAAPFLSALKNGNQESLHVPERSRCIAPISICIVNIYTPHTHTHAVYILLHTHTHTHTYTHTHTHTHTHTQTHTQDLPAGDSQAQHAPPSFSAPSIPCPPPPSPTARRPSLTRPSSVETVGTVGKERWEWEGDRLRRKGRLKGGKEGVREGGAWSKVFFRLRACDDVALRK
jgi:hypothetical protein